MNLVKDKRTLLGFGLGIIFATLLLSLFNTNKAMTDAQVEIRARELGMEYREEFKVLDKDVKE